MASSASRYVIYILFAGLSVQTSAQAPIVTVPSTQYEQELCTTVVLDCYVTGFRTEIIWNFNQIVLNRTGDARYRNGHTTIPALTIQGVRTADSGTYQCIAKNGALTTNSELITLNVIPSSTNNQQGGVAPNNINISPSSINQNEGTNAALTCSADGDSDITYSWSTDNFNTFQRGSVRVFSPLNRADTAMYTCKAQSCYGEALSQVFVNVTYMPTTPTINPTTVVVNIGGTISISCSSTGNPTVSYTWYKDNTVVSSAAVLQITNANPGHGGNYTCRATNSLGFTQSSLNVDIQYPPSSGEVSPSSVNVSEGNSFTLTCNIMSNPTPTYEWYQNGVLLQDTGKVLTRNNVQYNGRNIEVFVCKATNSMGSAEATANVNIQFSPKDITITPQSRLNVTEGGSFTLTCSANGNPAPTFEWYRNEVLISRTNELPRNNVNKNDDNGDYICKVTNTIGSTQETANVNIQYAPVSIATQPAAATIGTPVTLSCETNANPPVTSYTWFRGSDTIQNAGGKDYVVDMNEDSDFGQYTCRVSNGIGNPLNIGFTIASESAEGPNTGAATASSGLTTGEIAAIVLAILFVLLLIIALIICCCCTGYCAGVCGKKNDKVEPTKDKYVEEPKKISTLEIPRFYERSVEVTEPPAETEVKRLRHKKHKPHRGYSDEFEINRYTVLKPDDNKQLYITSSDYGTGNMYVTEREIRDKENMYITENGTYERDNLYVSDSGTQDRDNIYISENVYPPELQYTYDYEEERRRRRRKKNKRKSRHHRRHFDEMSSRDNDFIVEERIINGDVLRSSVRSHRNHEDERYFRSGRDDLEVIPGPEYYSEC